MARQAIAGLRYGQGFCLLRLRQPPGPALADFLGELAGARVNLTMLGGPGLAGPEAEICLCLPQEHLAQAWQAARELAAGLGGPTPEVVAPVSTLTLYPLGPGLSLCWRVLAGLAGAGLCPLALGSSLSALVAVLPQDDLAAALKALEAVVDLPPGLGPSPQEVQVVQVAGPGRD